MLDIRKTVDELAAEIVILKDGTDLEKDIGLRAILLGDKTLGVARDPNLYANIFKRAGDLPEASDWMKNACAIEMVNGRRRDSYSCSFVSVENMRDALLSLSVNDALLSGKKDYNLALLERMLRNYHAASLIHQRSARAFANAGQTVDALVALFVADVESASDALVNGDYETITEAIDRLLETECVVRGATDPYPTWMAENAAVHIVWAQMMAACVLDYCCNDVLYFVTDEMFTEALVAAEKKMPHWHTVLRMAKLCDEREYDRVLEMGSDALQNLGGVKSSSIGNTQLTWKILMARACFYLNREKEANDRLNEVISHSGLDGGVPMSAADSMKR